MRKIIIGIQARSDSQRLPGKAQLPVGGKPILQWVIDSCNQAIRYLGQGANRNFEAEITTILLVPKGDALSQIYQSQLPVYEGSHDDVLSRYAEATRLLNPDFIVRITADCLEIPSYVIAKHIRSALIKGRDYTTNTHYRTFSEGWDCEVLSRRLVEWLDENASAKHDREHVTTLIAPDRGFPFVDSDGKKNICHIIGPVDESDRKTSIDTREDYETAIKRHERFMNTKIQARRNGVFYH